MRYIRFLVFTWAMLMFTALSGQATTRQVKDLVGRTMQVPQDPQRVVALAPSVTEIIFALQQQQRLVGVTRFSDHPPQAQHMAKVGSYVHLDTERIVALRPDLCIGMRDGNPLAVVQLLEKLQIPVFVVDPHNLTSVMQSIESIGDLLDAQKRASTVVADMRRRIANIKKVTQQISHKPKVFLQIGISPIVTIGEQTFIHELIELAGGLNVAAGPVPYPRFSREEVIAMAPDVIIITSMARSTVFEQVRREWLQWTMIPAVQRGAVFVAPSNLFDRPTPRLVDGIEQLARYIHPNLFKNQP